MELLSGSVVKNMPANAGDMGLICGSGGSPGGRNGNPLQDTSRENQRDRGAWDSAVHGVTKNQTWLSNSVSSITQSRPTLWPHGLQHARLPCPSPTLGACSNSCLLSRWCHPPISCSVIPFSSCLQSLTLTPTPTHQNLPWISSSHQVVKVLELQLENQSFQWIFRTDFL